MPKCLIFLRSKFLRFNPQQCKQSFFYLKSKNQCQSNESCEVNVSLLANSILCLSHTNLTFWSLQGILQLTGANRLKGVFVTFTYCYKAIHSFSVSCSIYQTNVNNHAHFLLALNQYKHVYFWWDNPVRIQLTYSLVPNYYHLITLLENIVFIQ